MSINSSNTFVVANSSVVSADVVATVQPAVGLGTGGKGRLVHPTLGPGATPFTYDYLEMPAITENVLSASAPAPVWSNRRTFGGSQQTQWAGTVDGQLVIERFERGAVGCSLDHLANLWAIFQAPPPAGQFVTWSPNYLQAGTYNVVLEALLVEGKIYSLDTRLAGLGYAPKPVELHIRLKGIGS